MWNVSFLVVVVALASGHAAMAETVAPQGAVPPGAATEQASPTGVHVPGMTGGAVPPNPLTGLNLCGIPLALIEMHERGTVLYVGPALLSRIMQYGDAPSIVNVVELSAIYPKLSRMCDKKVFQQAVLQPGDASGP